MKKLSNKLPLPSLSTVVRSGLLRKVTKPIATTSGTAVSNMRQAQKALRTATQEAWERMGGSFQPPNPSRALDIKLSSVNNAPRIKEAGVPLWIAPVTGAVAAGMEGDPVTGNAIVGGLLGGGLGGTGAYLASLLGLYLLKGVTNSQALNQFLKKYRKELLTLGTMVGSYAGGASGGRAGSAIDEALHGLGDIALDPIRKLRERARRRKAEVPGGYEAMPQVPLFTQPMNPSIMAQPAMLY